MKGVLRVLMALSLGASATWADTAADLARATVVVYNRKAPDSIALAYSYARARHIPDDHLLGLECSTGEEISREAYDATIAEPLRKIFLDRQWWTLGRESEGHPVLRSTSIHFIALVRGMPLKIRATENYKGDNVENNPSGKENNAAVDSELSVLGLFSRQISGATGNPYFQSFRPVKELDRLPLLLVCRLDGPSEAIVRQMISDAIETETSGLWGRAYVDGAGHTSGPLADGDRWLQELVKDLREVGIPVVYDNEDTLFPTGFPMNDCALYYGWYAGEVAGSLNDPGFSFAPGAIAVHIHSFSANTLRSADANWVGPLLSKGAAASLGNVYEPFLQLTHHLDIFNDRLLHGFTFAESAYMSLRTISWMNTAVGDPLYRPYANWIQIDPKADDRKKSDWRMYHDFAVKNATLKPAEYLRAARATASKAENGPMIEDLGLKQEEAGDFSSAVSCLRQARTLYSKPDDILRTVLEQVDALIKSGDKKAGAALAHETRRLAPDAPAAALLGQIEARLNPPPANQRPSP